MNDGSSENGLVTLCCVVQVGRHEERAQGEGVRAAGHNQKTLSQTPAGPESLTDTKTRPGDQQEGKCSKLHIKHILLDFKFQ